MNVLRLFLFTDDFILLISAKCNNLFSLFKVYETAFIKACPQKQKESVKITGIWDVALCSLVEIC